MNERILVAEDDPAILAGLVDLLGLEGYVVDEVSDGAAALGRFQSLCPDLVLLDVMMPKMNGYDVCRAIRREDSTTPVLMLTAKGEEIDRVIGLELGADDYIVKPFGMAELLARVRSALRRGALSKGAGSAEPRVLSRLRLGDAVVDFGSMTGRRGDVSFTLTPKESALLLCLAANEGRVVSREALLETVWGIDCEITTRSIDQHVARLRQKLEDDPSAPRFLCTVHGVGYRLESGDRGGTVQE
ncbi:MAG: response regulator transcription factor [Synergistaceae bacterium]|jgi:DNA-binding response OmpR family regulator|nr:response regulator transcription factor [Synergistaceae bacterium]